MLRIQYPLPSALLLCGISTAALAVGDQVRILWRFEMDSAISGHHVSVGPNGTIYASDNTMLYALNPGGSQGNLCPGSPIGRFISLVQSSGSQGTISIPVDLTNLPLFVPAMPGETFHFQCWFRDVGVSSNFTDAVSADFN